MSGGSTALQSLVYDDIYEYCRDLEGKLLPWLWSLGVLGYFNVDCLSCKHGKVGLRKDTSRAADGLVWRCSNKKCGYKVSIRKFSWFEKSHLTIPQIVKLTYYWTYNTQQEVVERELRIGSDHTLVDWYNFAREICITVLEAGSEVIGGPGCIVEIDESKFGKRKFNKGRRVDGVWVFGGICRDTRRCFFQCVDDRSAETLIPIIQRYVRPGTTIYSDCWKAYSSLSSLGYIHQTVNHSIEFKAADGTCTNLIESTWRAVKQSLPKYGTNKDLYESYFAEYCIRKKYFTSSGDRFLTFLELVKRVYNPGQDKLTWERKKKPTLVKTRTSPRKLSATKDDQVRSSPRKRKIFSEIANNSLDDFES